MQYTTIKRFKRKGIDGDFNIPYNTKLEKRDDGGLYYDNRPVCLARSFAAHEHFSKDDDNNGAIRGELSHRIIKKLDGTHKEMTPEWEKIYNDEVALKFKNKNHKDTWLWSDDFFNASISDLQHIASLIGA